MEANSEIERVRVILSAVKPLAAEYYMLTGKPLGVTGEVAEYVAAELLGLELAPPRTEGFDAVRRSQPDRSAFKLKAGRFPVVPATVSVWGGSSVVRPATWSS